ncbi:hypothetical protein FHT29_003059 [Rhizobium sp. SG741]|nr:hypothetical protein [Rhizobium sp. SG741]
MARRPTSSYGLRLLPEGRRRSELEAAILATSPLRAGRPINQFDAQIAAVAASRGATLATRNVPDFLDTGIAIVNPWNYRD